MEETVLTREQVNVLGLDRVSVITSDMLEGYTHIDSYAFAWCYELTSVTIPNSVINIGDYAFYCCSSLTSVTIPNSVTSIGKYAFHCCSSLPVINNLLYADTYLVGAVDRTRSNYTIKDGTRWIGWYAFDDCNELTSITIPNSVISIGDYAFYHCSSLISVEIPNSVIHIGYCAFSHCKFRKKRKTDKQGRVVAYKGFTSNLTCRGFQYKEGGTYEIKKEPKLCERGFHACLNPLDCFAYYYGHIGKDVVFHEVYLEGVTDKKGRDSKVASKKITIGREISPSEMSDIASRRK